MSFHSISTPIKPAICPVNAIASIFNARLSSRATIFFIHINTDSKIKWFEKEFPEKTNKIAKYLMISSYVLGRLGDIPIDEAVIDASYTEWTGLADVRKRKWSSKILEALKINENQLPIIVNSNKICGYLSEKMSTCCGLRSGVPLVAGAGDKPAGCLGSAMVNPGDTILEAASYGGFSCCVTDYRPDYKNRRLDIIPSVIPGEFYIHNYIAGSGITLDWFVKNFVAANNQLSDDLFQEIDKKVDLIKPGSDGLMAIGMLGGRAFPLDPSIRGLWLGHNWSHRKEHFYRALLESFAYEYALTINSLVDLYPEFNNLKVNIIGGGAKSMVLTQINADVCNRAYRRLNREDVALWGAAIIAGNAVGIFPDMKMTARKHIEVLTEYFPNNAKHKEYIKYMALYAKFIDSFSKYFEALQDI